MKMKKSENSILHGKLGERIYHCQFKIQMFYYHQTPNPAAVLKVARLDDVS